MNSEKVSVFNRLIGLYGSRSLESGARTPLEDFTTEIFASILESNRTVLTSFLEMIVHVDQNLIASSAVKVRTQQRFVLKDDTNCRVDLVIRNANFVCFIENKVDSGEGYRQLERYEKALREQEVEHKYLCYCTKFWDQKETETERFRQFRWAEIYKLLIRYEPDTLISHFTEFLKRNGMGAMHELCDSDLHVMENVVEVLGKLGDILEEVRHHYEVITGRKAEWGDRYKQLAQFKRYVCYDRGVLRGNGYSELGFGFEIKTVPSLYFWIWARVDSDVWKNNEDGLFKIFEDGRQEDRGYVAVLQDLSHFKSIPKMHEEVVGWFVEKFRRILEYDGFINDQSPVLYQEGVEGEK